MTSIILLHWNVLKLKTVINMALIFPTKIKPVIHTCNYCLDSLCKIYFTWLLTSFLYSNQILTTLSAIKVIFVLRFWVGCVCSYECIHSYQKPILCKITMTALILLLTSITVPLLNKTHISDWMASSYLFSSPTLTFLLNIDSVSVL